MSDSALRVLIVEDEPLYGRLLTAFVHSLGHVPVGPATSGEEALQLFDQEPRPQLALLDINLSGSLDGIDVAEALLARQRVPLIFNTSLADTATFNRAKQVGPSAYLVKPFDQVVLERAIALALHNFATGQTATAP